MKPMMSSTALCTESDRRTNERERSTYRAGIHEGANDVREKRGDVRLSNLRFIARDFEAHPDLEVAELALKLALLRILAEPPVKRVSLVTTSRRT
jgi:hypothetical protein